MSRLKLWLAAALVLGVSAWGASASAAEPSYREIKDWIIACDNGGTCLAKFVLDDMATKSSLPDNATQGFLSITREAGPNGKLVITTQSMAEGEHTPFDPAKMTLDGKPLTAAWTTDAEGNNVITGGAAAIFVAAIGDGNVLAFTSGHDPELVSLSGLKAVLLAMDVFQGRVGTVTALAHPGDGPASGVAAPPVLPVVISAPMTDALPNAETFAAKVRAHATKTLKAHNCDGDASLDEAHALNKSEAIVILFCTEAAYQGSSLLYRAPRAAPGKAVLVLLPTPSTIQADGADVAGEYSEAAWDEKTATFTESAKGRGLADCGITTEWVFDGKAFHLASFSRQERCGGPPGDWPTLYRSTIKPAR